MVRIFASTPDTDHEMSAWNTVDGIDFLTSRFSQMLGKKCWVARACRFLEQFIIRRSWVFKSCLCDHEDLLQNRISRKFLLEKLWRSAANGTSPWLFNGLVLRFGPQIAFCNWTFACFQKFRRNRPSRIQSRTVPKSVPRKCSLWNSQSCPRIRWQLPSGVCWHHENTHMEKLRIDAS